MKHFLTKIFSYLKDVFKNKENRTIAYRYLVGIGIICASIYIAESCKSCNDSASYRSTYSDNKIDAYIAAKNVINSVLKAPSTAKYPSYDESMVTISGDLHTVTDYVDSQNSFGAMLRAKYTVVLRSSGGEWLTESVIFDGNKLK
ncbi:MAG: hypothetical protein ACK5M3_03945 [Dysgonomonas sp.]